MAKGADGQGQIDASTPDPHVTGQPAPDRPAARAFPTYRSIPAWRMNPADSEDSPTSGQGGFARHLDKTCYGARALPHLPLGIGGLIQGGARGKGATAQLAVHHQDCGLVLADTLNFGSDLAGSGLFFDLFVAEPGQERLGRASPRYFE